MIISYNQTVELCNLIKMSVDFMLNKGTDNLQNYEYNKTAIHFTESYIQVFYDGLHVFCITKQVYYESQSRFDVGKSMTCFFIYPPNKKNNFGSFFDNNSYLDIPVQEKTSESEWDSVAFQNSILYGGESPSVAMIEPFISELIANERTRCHMKMYCISESWVDLPFSEMWDDSFFIYNNLA